jgi:hypothetical protein
VQEADAIYREEVDKAGVARNLGQYFAALTNMRSVGVMGDGRTYDYAIALRAVHERLHDCRMCNRSSVGSSAESHEPDHQRSQRRQPSNVRLHWKTASYYRIRVTFLSRGTAKVSLAECFLLMSVWVWN